MINGKSFLAIIPARGGSKRLPRKNILALEGRPLISWTIQAALGCPFIDEVMVTTDDNEIAEISKQCGANVPFIRPAFLATEAATSFDVIEHAINYYIDELGKKFDYVILLQPTSPLRNSQDIIEAIELLVKKNANAVVSVCEVEHSPLWTNRLPLDRSMVEFLAGNLKNMRSQDLDTFYRLNGAIYLCNIELLMDQKTFWIDKEIYAHVMPIAHSVDIDTYVDFLTAKAIIQSSKFQD